MSMTKTTKIKPITKAEVREALRKLKRENPDTVNPHIVNPWGSNICLYHKGRGRNIRRCLIGQMAYDMGLPTPTAEAGGADDVATEGVWAGRFTDAAAAYMWEVQKQADGGSFAPLPWGKVKL